MKSQFIKAATLSLFIITSCTDNVDKMIYSPRTLSEIKESGELRVITLNSSSSYFIYEDREMGYEYEMAKYLAGALGVKLKVIVSPNGTSMVDRLIQAEGDIITFPVSYSKINADKRIEVCGPVYTTRQVLVQRKDKKRKCDIYDLVGKQITVENNSKYHQRLLNLNDEIGGGLIIKPLEEDTLTTERLIEMVASGDIDYTLADDNFARLNKTLYDNLDISVPMSLTQKSAWVIPVQSDSLKAFADSCLNSRNKTPEYAAITKRYYAKSRQYDVPMKYLLNDGRLCVYDDLFKKHAPILGWDWRLLAAISFEESRFDPEAKSKSGAKGLMQLMPITAKHNGLTDDNLTDPDANIEAGTKLISYLQKRFSRIEDPQERTKFVLGAFHTGLGHISDAVAIARKYGYADSIWDDNVAHCLKLKTDSVYFSDTTTVKHGYFPGNTTITHVNKIIERYEEFRDRVN